MRLRVTDNGGVTDITTADDQRRLAARRRRSPSPAAGTTWKVGDSIAFAGSAVDDNGAAIPASGLAWRLDLVQCAPVGRRLPDHPRPDRVRGRVGIVHRPAGAVSGLPRAAPHGDGHPRPPDHGHAAPGPAHGGAHARLRPGRPEADARQRDAWRARSRATWWSDRPTPSPPSRPQSQGLSNYVFGVVVGRRRADAHDHGAGHRDDLQGDLQRRDGRCDARGHGDGRAGRRQRPGRLAEAFRTTASTTGPVSWLTVYLDSSATATELVAGLYADAAGKPGALLTTGRLDLAGRGCLEPDPRAERERHRRRRRTGSRCSARPARRGRCASATP